MHPVARVSTNICRNLRMQQMSVLVLLCTSYTACFGPYWWPSSGGLYYKKFEGSYRICQRICCFSTYKGKCRSQVSFNNLRAIKYKIYLCLTYVTVYILYFMARRLLKLFLKCFLTMDCVGIGVAQSI
jgi:hypothetical protein